MILLYDRSLVSIFWMDHKPVKSIARIWTSWSRQQGVIFPWISSLDGFPKFYVLWSQEAENPISITGIRKRLWALAHFDQAHKGPPLAASTCWNALSQAPLLDGPFSYVWLSVSSVCLTFYKQKWKLGNIMSHLRTWLDWVVHLREKGKAERQTETPPSLVHLPNACSGLRQPQSGARSQEQSRVPLWVTGAQFLELLLLSGVYMSRKLQNGLLVS